MIRSLFLKKGSCLTLTAGCGGDDVLHLIVGGGRGCVFDCDVPLAGAWIPLRGRLQLGTSAAETVARGEVVTTEAVTGLRAIGRGNALWTALLGTRAAWHRALAGVSEIPIPELMLLPARQRADFALRRHAIALVRAAGDGSAETVANALIERIWALQNVFGSSIERCPGRSYLQRRQVFLRLQRVRNYIASHCHLDLENEELARLASYSPWQFIRAFRNAYAQTPHAFLIEQRLRRAQRLLGTSPLSIAEVAAACGFEDRCAFSRLFSDRFGITARDFRRARPAAPNLRQLDENTSRNFCNAA